jgi:hypothetical protein
MILSAYTSAPSMGKFKFAVKLEGADNFQAWKIALNTACFFKIKRPSLDGLTSGDTLDPTFFKKTFPDEYKSAEKDDSGVKQHPFDEPEFLQKCLDFALHTGAGLCDWVYEVFAGIRASLSEEIAAQTAGVPMGDLVSLIQGITLAIGHYEVFDHDDIECEYSSATMALHGKNDVMTFMAVLRTFMRRLSTAGHAVADTKAQRVLLRGLDQDVFASFITTSEATKHANYSLLEKALKNYASKPHTLAKLKALKPGLSHSVLVTRDTANPDASASQRLDNVEASLASILAKLETMAGTGTKLRKEDCFQFNKSGSCHKGAGCPYKHNTPTRITTDSGKYCILHKTAGTHNTADCSLVKNDPDIKERLGIDASAAAIYTTIPGPTNVMGDFEL